MNIQPGTRVELISMPDDPDPVPTGTQGTVIGSAMHPPSDEVLEVRWDNGRTLNLLTKIDGFRIISTPGKQPVADDLSQELSPAMRRSMKGEKP